MCGIIGYIGKKECVPYLIEGLKALEYRGYDSAGLAVNSESGVNVVREVGKVAMLEAEVKRSNPKGFAGIAHTRWATHGKPTHMNSHPQSDCSGEIAVVHNGIVENYLAFKDRLIKKGHIFTSETDTEIIAHLIEEHLKGAKGDREQSLLEAVAAAIKELDGSYAIAVIWAQAPGIVVGSRKKSPLVAGIGVHENFLGSDTSAFRKDTNKAVYLDDGDIAVISKDDVKIYDSELKSKAYKVITIEQSASMAGKNGLEHYMLKEIREQPSTVCCTIESVLIDIDSAFGIDPSHLKGIKNIMLVGCGTAYHATMVAKYWLEEFSGIPTQAELASEYKYRKVAMPAETLAVFVSQSGETADTLAALEKAKAAGFKTVAICNVYGSTISRVSDYTFFTKCGPEISVASTKAFTAQLAALFALSALVGRSVGHINEKRASELMAELSKIPQTINDAVLLEPQIKNIAQKYYKCKSFVFLGRNVNFPIALEGALKLKEITYLHAEGFAAGEIKHGPIALIDEGMPVVSIMPYDELFDKMNNACQEVMARGAAVIAVTDKKGGAVISGKIENCIMLDDTPSYLFPIVDVVALQLFAYWVARLNGREIDQPRNLAKSVTVE